MENATNMSGINILHKWNSKHNRKFSDILTQVASTFPACSQQLCKLLSDITIHHKQLRVFHWIVIILFSIKTQEMAFVF